MRFEIDMDLAFQRIFTEAGQTTLECSCGREHISMHGMDHWDFDEGESTPEEMRADWEEQAKTNDMLVLDYEYDGFEMVELGGNYWVAGCECKGWDKAVNLLVDNRLKIARFLIETSKEIKRVQAYEEVMDVLEKEYE